MWNILDNQIIFESYKDDNKHIDKFLSIYPSVIDKYQKTYTPTVHAQELAYGQALEKLDGLIALDVHIRDSDTYVSFISPSVDNLLCYEYNFKKVDNYTAYCKTDVEYVFVFTNTKSFISHITSCIKQCKNKKQIISTLNDSIEEYDGKLGISPIPIHYAIDINRFGNLTYDELDELFS